MTKCRLGPLFSAGLLAVASIACGQPHQDLADVRRAMTSTENASHVYQYTDTAGGRSVSVTVALQDSFRSRASLAVNGQPLLDEALVDDGIGLRLLTPGKWNPAAGTPLRPSTSTGKAGGASFTRRLRSSNSAFNRPWTVPATTRSPTCKVPRCSWR